MPRFFVETPNPLIPNGPLHPEDKTFLTSYDLAPHPPPTLPRQFLTEEGGGGGRGTKSYDHEKVWSSINHSILSAYTHIKSNNPPCNQRRIETQIGWGNIRFF
jgi:hypothetical protein